LGKAFGCDWCPKDNANSLFPGEPVKEGQSFLIEDKHMKLEVVIKKLVGEPCHGCFGKRTREMFRKMLLGGSILLSSGEVAPISLSNEKPANVHSKDAGGSKKVLSSKAGDRKAKSDNYITTDEAAELLGIKRTSVWDIAARQNLIVYKQAKRKAPLELSLASVLNLRDKRNEEAAASKNGDAVNIYGEVV